METVESGGVLEVYDAHEAAANKKIGDLLWARQHPIQNMLQTQRRAAKEIGHLIAEATKRYVLRTISRQRKNK